MILAFWIACTGPRPTDVPPPPSAPASAPATLPPPVAVEEPPPPGEPVPPPTEPVPPVEGGPAVTSLQMYEGCRARVEGIDTPGECTTDADCGTAGCSQEACVAKAVAGDVSTTCEALPCFAVLDTCGCHGGACTWTVKAETGLLKRPPLP